MKFTDHMVQPFSEIFGFWDEIIHIFWSRTKRTFTPFKFGWKGTLKHAPFSYAFYWWL